MKPRIPEYPHPRFPDIDMPPKKAQLVGGPFDGKIYFYDVEFFEPDERRYRLLYEENIIEDATIMSKKFPEGAVYRWTPKEKCWNYIGKPSKESEDNFCKFLGFFGVKPNKPL